MIRLAQTGENGMLWNAIGVAGGVLSSRRRPDYVRAVEIVLVTLAANTLVKYIVRRARPVLEEELPALTPVLSGRSYPSAHASTSFAGARALAAAGLPSAPLHAVAWPWPSRGPIWACTTRRTWWRARSSATPWPASWSASRHPVTREITRAISSVKSMPAAWAA